VESSIAAVDLARPWRTTAIVASAVAVLELAVILVAGVALLAKPVANQVRASANEPAHAPVSPAPDRPERPEVDRPPLPRSETSVLVLNGDGRTGAAAEAADRVRGAGYIVGSVGNASRSDYGKSVVMYRPGFEGEAKRLARDLKIPIVGPLDGLTVKQLLGAHLALVVAT
jgi:hypothetical protein